MNWENLPTVVISEIFDYLSYHDRLQASSVNFHWRNVIFQPKFFQGIHFNISLENDKKNKFYLQTIANLAHEVKITFDSSNLYDVELATEILFKLSKSCCLVNLLLRPKYATIITPGKFYSEEEWNFIYSLFIEPIKRLLGRPQPSLRILDLGCSEILTHHAAEMTNCAARPQNIKVLGFASIKQDPSHYALSMMNPNLFEKCSSLQVLSLDYDVMCDDFVESLSMLTSLKKIILHVHGLDDNHPGISEQAWTNLRDKNPHVEVSLTLVAAYEAVDVLHMNIFRPSMPLAKLKVLFCEKINCDALEYISRHYKDTIKSMVWIDSMRMQEYRNIMELLFRTEQDPLVMAAWRCKKLEEIIMHGYILDSHNLVGISRLRGQALKKLEVSRVDLSISTAMLTPFIEEISTQLGQTWAPLDVKTLPAALGFYPVSDEIRDQYILEFLRSDLE